MASVLNRPELALKGLRPTDGVKDMIWISDIDEKGINTNLKVRYQQDLIYTFTGSILVAVNPYKELTCYQHKDVSAYSGRKINQVEPHVFAIAEAAYQSLQGSGFNQSCIISGESGAGKTESTKFILQYLCSVTNHTSFWTEQQILEANTVLEAFGNAKTVRNDNSSRFGKFMQVCFSGSQIKGCIVQDYLLEQSRITFQSGQERNYHVFYQLTAAAQACPQLAQAYMLGPAQSYHYLNQSGCFCLDGVNDCAMLDNLRLAMNVLGITEDMSRGLFSVLSAVLWLGNLQFQGVDGDSDKSELAPSDADTVSRVCRLLGLEVTSFQDIALFRQIQVRGTVTSIPFKLQEASENRHAMAKALYSRTFAWLVDAINKCTNPGAHHRHFIGILDIFGFENFQTNSFEQLCINFTNEKLHRFFNHYVFALEQESYREEGIEFSHITFTDNTACVELIEKAPKCVLKMLDEECRFPQGTDKSYLIKQHQELEDHPSYIKGDRRHWEKEFGIQHYAGIVVYTVQGFLDKNKDTQQDNLFELMRSAKNIFVQDLTRFQDLLGVKLEVLQGRQTISRTASRGKPTVGDTFKHQLSALVDVLDLTNPWYVRCLKPNSSKCPNNYVEDEVLLQLRYSGMLDIIRIKREGYPVHVPVDTFLSKYGILLDRSLKESRADVCVRSILTSLGVHKTDWQVGKTKVFMKNSVFDPLEEHRQRILQSKAVLIQKLWRGFSCWKDYQKKKHAVLILQDIFRTYKLRLKFLRQRRAAVRIQTYYRRHLAKQKVTFMKMQKQQEEERRRIEEAERERKRKDRESADELAIEEALKQSQQELESLTQLMESMWTHCQPAVSASSLDLDTMFNFLEEERQERRAENLAKMAALDQINQEFTTLDDLWKEAEGETVSKDELELEAAFEEVNKSLQEFEASSLTNCSEALLAATSTVVASSAGTCLELSSAESPQLPPPPPPSEDLDLSLPPPPPPPPPFPHDEASPGVSFDTPFEPPPGISQATAFISSYIIPAPPPITDSGDALSPLQESPKPESEQSSLLLPPPPPPPPPPAVGTSFESSVFQFPPQAALPPQIEKTENPYAELKEVHTTIRTQLSHEDQHLVRTPPALPPLPHSFSALASPTPASSAMTLRFKPASESGLPRKDRELGQLSPSTQQRLSCLMSYSQSQVSSPGSEPSPTKDSQAQPETFYDIREYAEKFFNDHERDASGTIIKSLKKRSKQSSLAEYLTKEEMLRFSKSGLIPTSHIHLHDAENINQACILFKELTRFMRDEVKDQSALKTIHLVVGTGIEKLELRDEILVQLLRQTNENPELASLRQAWTVLCLCTAAFMPSKNLHKYLLSYVKRCCSDPVGGKYAMMCYQHLTIARATTRKYPPSTMEIMSVQTQTPIICKVFFMDGKTKAVRLQPADTTQEVLAQVTKKIGLLSVEGWALYEVTADSERFIRSHEYICDILARWEGSDSLSTQASVYETISRKGPKVALGGADSRLVFRKRVYRHVHDIPNDPIEYHLLYAEAVHKVVKCDEFSVSDKVGLQLAGLQAQVIWGQFQPDKEFRYSEADQYLCQRILASCGKNWSQEVAKAHMHYGGTKSELEAKVWYLTCVKQFSLYGCTLFPIMHKGMWSHTSESLLAVNMDGIKFVRVKDKTVLHDFKYSEIESFMFDPNDNYVTLELYNTAQAGLCQKTFVFETSQKEDIGHLIASYSPGHASRMRADNDSLKKIKMSDEDKLKLYEELVRCRKALSESRLLQRPVQDSGQSFIRNTLRRLTKSKMDRMRMLATSDVSSSFSVDYWSYSRTAIKQSLTVIFDPSQEEAAVRMFTHILVYAGVEESDDCQEGTRVSLIQNLMQQCLESDFICNEFFLQLIKQTTDHPDKKYNYKPHPNSIINCRSWQLMVIISCTLPPANTRVQKYVLCHLKKCSMDAATEEGKYARFALKCLNRTIEKKRRKLPPSVQEIECVIQRKPITQKIDFLNGEQRILEFDSAATCGEVIKNVKTKIGMRSDASCFAIYEVMGSTERCLAQDEHLADTVSKWERLSSSGGVRDLKLIFKKRLFIEPYVNTSDPVECDLLFSQLVEDVFEQRIPITHREAIHLCALKAQSEMDDMKTGETDYLSVMRILPRDMRLTVRPEEIATTHKTLLDLSPQQAVVSFMNLLTSWELFGTTLFTVSQSYTSSLPKSLLLGVGQFGIHLLEQDTFRTLAAYKYSEIVHASPAIKSIMIVTGHMTKGVKFMFSTNQAQQIADLIKDYVEELQARVSLQVPKEIVSAASKTNNEIDELERQNAAIQAMDIFH